MYKNLVDIEVYHTRFMILCIIQVKVTVLSDVQWRQFQYFYKGH